VVEGASDTPLADVAVSLRGLADRDAHTGLDGRFVFEGLPDGEYQLHAVRDGFAPASHAVRLTGGEVVDVALKLWVHGVEWITVTAAKTGESDPHATPIAISVLSGAELQRAKAHTIEDVAGRLPSVTFSQNTGFGQLTIRGIGTNVVFAGSDPSSAVYLDGVYLARPAMVLGDLLDVERVEALRGPQGTLYGRNAVGGALNLVTRSPTNEVEAFARVVAGSFDTLRGEAWLSGPVVSGRLTGRGAFLRGVGRGFVRDRDHPDRPLGGEDVTAARGKLHFLISARSDLVVSGDVTHQDPTPLTYAKVLAVKPGFTVDNPPDLHEVRTSTPAESRSLHYGAAARLTVRLAADTTLTSLTAFRKLDYDVLVDTDITELDLAASRVHEIQRQWSEEVTVSRQRPGLTWVGGLFLLDDVDRQPTRIRLGGPGLENRLDPRVETTSGAAFGQATIGLGRRVSATAGLRYTRERKAIDNMGGLYPLEPMAGLVPGSGYAYADAMSHHAWTPKVGLEVRAGASALAYLSATRGFKSGGFNISSPERGRGYHPEWAWSFEGGLKTTLAGGRARLGVSAFQTDYTDLQVQTAIRPGVLDISNAAAATIRGVEVEGAAGPWPTLQVGGHLAWLDATYDRYVAVGTGGVTADVAGNRLSNAPEWSGRLWIEGKADAGRAGTLSLRADWRWQSTVFFTPFNDAVQRQQPYGLLDLSLEVGPKRWSLGAYVRNLTNEQHITGTFASPPPAIGGRPGEPRMMGVQLTFRR
jgi:iron complex outermembrane receptor protein